jgi:hypothetical protein
LAKAKKRAMHKKKLGAGTCSRLAHGVVHGRTADLHEEDSAGARPAWSRRHLFC